MKVSVGNNDPTITDPILKFGIKTKRSTEGNLTRLSPRSASSVRLPPPSPNKEGRTKKPPRDKRRKSILTVGWLRRSRTVVVKEGHRCSLGLTVIKIYGIEGASMIVVKDESSDSK